MTTTLATPPMDRTTSGRSILSLNTNLRTTPAPIPNKHIPICSPGPIPLHGLQTPPASPPQREPVIETPSQLYPPDKYEKLSSSPLLYSISASSLAEALDQIACQPLPDTKAVFPWLHGLHPENQIQLAFFLARKRTTKSVPRCIRGITIVKAGGDLTTSKIMGAISPDEILQPLDHDSSLDAFYDADPKGGFSVRNFQIQAAKMATVSDIVVYGDDSTTEEETIALARRISQAQRHWRKRQIDEGADPHTFHTFVLTDSFEILESRHPSLVSIDKGGIAKDGVFDFFLWERKEMNQMSKASRISHNVWLGPTPELSMKARKPSERPYDVFVETADLARVPTARSFDSFNDFLKYPDHPELHLEYASSGSILTPTWSQIEVDGLMEMCRWMYIISHDDPDDDKDNQHDEDYSRMSLDGTEYDEIVYPANKRILIHCGDGYTESSLLALAYYMYAEGVPAHEAWLKLHCDKKREFFAYPTDVALLMAIQPRILQESPAWHKGCLSSAVHPPWMGKMDGSLPSRILPYMYLGNLGHANNPELLKELGITRILSVGEPLAWANNSGLLTQHWPKENLLYIDRVQDNGVDPLTVEFPRCLEFIDSGKKEGGATLVHCRVGVSRSATICIAEVMRELGLSFPRAYTYVRARRLNVIIQPHLRFVYELLKWEEVLYARRNGEGKVRREIEWGTVCREISRMNRAYVR